MLRACAGIDAVIHLAGEPRGLSGTEQRTVTVAGTTGVGAFAANAFGLHDVHGNAAELVQDCHEDPIGGGTTCSVRVVRGGSWANPPELLRSAYRSWCARAR